MHPFSPQVHLPYLLAFVLCAGAIADLALAVFTEKLAADRVLRYAAATIMAVFAVVTCVARLDILSLSAFAFCMACVQIPLFIRTRRALRASESGGKAA